MMFSYKVEVISFSGRNDCSKTFSKVFNSRAQALKEIKKQNKQERNYVWVSVMDTAKQKYNRMFYGGKIIEKKQEW